MSSVELQKTQAFACPQLDLIALINEVKINLNREEVIRILSYIGYSFNRNGKFKLRPEERTASACVDKQNNIHDFGSGWHGDIISVLKEYHSLSTLQATLYVADCIGVSYEA